MIDLVNLVLLLLMTLSAVAVLWIRNLFAVAVLSGTYSLFAASLYVLLDAVDVAFTEAAVGAGISTVLLLATLALTGHKIGHREKPGAMYPLAGLIVVIVTGGLLIYGTFEMPKFQDADAPIHRHVADRYIGKSAAEVGPPNIVTSVLASYRGYDTLGEVTVIFTAAVGVLALLGASGRRRRNKMTKS